jgi:hypothetical protein
MRLPADLMVELGELTGIAWNSWELEPIICDAIRRYMHPPAVAAQEQTSTASGAGYQWKQVYLPDGTRLRASFGGTPYFATVTGTEIKSGDLALTPSGFANLQGSGNRNAWKAVWLRFPGNEQWVLADVCRTKQKAAIAACSPARTTWQPIRRPNRLNRLALPKQPQRPSPPSGPSGRSAPLARRSRQQHRRRSQRQRPGKPRPHRMASNTNSGNAAGAANAATRKARRPPRPLKTPC